MIDMNTRKASRLQITSFLCDTKILQIDEGQEYATQHRITIPLGEINLVFQNNKIFCQTNDGLIV